MLRSSSVISRPRDGIRTPSGSHFCTGSSSATSPSRAISASSVAVKTFVIEPISKIDRGPSGTWPRCQAPSTRGERTATTKPGVARARARQHVWMSLAHTVIIATIRTMNTQCV